MTALATASARDRARAWLALHGQSVPGSRAHATRDPRQRRGYAGDPYAYFHDILGVRLSPQQEEALDLIERETRVLLPSGNNLGKCLAPDEWVTLADGSRVQAKELVGRVFALFTLAGGDVVKARARAGWNLFEDVYEVTTETGRRIVRSGNHPLWCAGGWMRNGTRPRLAPGAWTPVSELRSGDRVAVAEGAPLFGSARMREEEVKVLAYLIGDGMVKYGRVGFTQMDNTQLAEFTSCAAALGCEVVRASGYDYRVVGAGRVKGKRNPIIELVRAHGLAGLGSDDKHVPDAIFRLAKDQCAIFLSRLYSTDGWACINSRGCGIQVGYGTNSERLARDVHGLLLRFGIRARLHRKNARAWTVSITTAEDAIRFADEIGIIGKEEALGAVVAHARARRWQRSSWRRQAAESFTAWERVKSVRRLPERQMTVAIEVPEHHTYLSEFYEHNTFLLGGYGVYLMDAVAAMPDEVLDLPEQGARLLLPGPDHATIKATIYSEMLALAARAERRGHLMPGRRSEDSVLWRVRPQWEVEAFSPPKNVQQDVAHTASGRHHRNQVALIEEGQGVEARVWKAAEGMCSSAGNKIVSSFNPTEPVGPAFERARSGAYVVYHLSAFRHPNLLQRAPVIPAAVDVKVIDARVRTDCRDRGPYPQTKPDPERGDFVYALPPKGAPEPGPRADGHLGHAEGALRVYRPGSTFTAQVLGQWPLNSDTTLFDPGAWDAAIARWKERPDPEEPADRVGVDAAREGNDETCAAPAWGETAEALLRAYVEIQDDPNLTERAMENLLTQRRVRVGEIRVMPKGDGHDVAHAIFTAFGDVPYNIDEASVGSSPLDFLRRVLECDVEGVSFAALPPDPMHPGFLPWCENVRTWMYVTAAKLVKLGLADVPDDPLLREELMAHWLEDKSRTVEHIDTKGRRLKKRVPSVLLCKKEKVKKIIGRSPDRADAFVLALFDAASAASSRKKKVKLAWGSRT